MKRFAKAVVSAFTMCALGATALATAPAANAASTVLCTGYGGCADKGYTDYGYNGAKSTSYWRMATGNQCTNYAAFRLVKRKYDAMANTRPWNSDGTARNWGPANKSKLNSTPAVGAVAWWPASSSSPSGHVAYVERVVSRSEIIISENNYNGGFAWRKLTKSGSWWPGGFIHFRDEDLNPVTKPTVSGTPRVGAILTASVGKWRTSSNTNPPSPAYKYQWLANGSTISGATSSKYVPTAGTVGKKISIKVTAADEGYKTVSATSGQTSAVTKGNFANSAVPKITGTPIVGGKLQASNGTWSPKPSSFAYQWYAGGTAIAGAKASSYQPSADTVGKAITVKVTVNLAGYNAASRTSGPTGAVQAAAAA